MQENVGQNIKRYRMSKGMKQEELCAGICSVSQLSKIETGKAQAKPEQLEQLAKRLGMTVEELESSDRLEQELALQLELAKQATQYGHFEKAFELTRLVMSSSKESGYKVLFASSAYHESYIYVRTNQWELVIQGLVRLIISAPEMDAVYWAKVYFFLGRAYYHTGQYERALGAYYETKLYVETMSDNHEEAALMYHFVADSMHYVRDYQKAYTYSVRAHELFMKEEKVHWALRAQSTVAHVFLMQKRYKESEALYQKNIQTSLAHTYAVDFAVATHNLGCIALLQEDYAKARTYLERALHSIELIKNDNTYILCEPYIELATVSVRERKFEEAERWLTKAEALLSGTSGLTALQEGRLAEIRAEASHLQGLTEECLQHLQRAHSIYHSHTAWFEAYEVAVQLAEKFETQQKVTAAVEMYRLAIASYERFERASNGLGPIWGSEM